MNPITQTIRERERIADEIQQHFFARGATVSKLDYDLVFNHITQSHIALLESVVGVVERMEGITIENRDDTKTELLNKQDILTELQEALKELKDKK